MLSQPQYFKRILALLDPNADVNPRGNTVRPLVVSAPTGSGKSTFLGFGLALREPNAKVWVSLPTTLAANNLFQWGINATKGTNIKVGLRAGGQNLGAKKEEANLFYTTTGFVIDTFYAALSKPETLLPNYLVLDEIHLRRIDEFLAMSLWQRYLATHEYVGPTLLLTSATVDPDQQYELASDFLGLVEKQTEQGTIADLRPREADFFVIDKIQLPITDVYEEKDFRNLYDRNRYQVMITRAVQNVKLGNILFLVPGVEEARDLIKRAEAAIKENNLMQVKLFSFHAGVTPEEKQGQMQQIKKLDKRQTAWIISTAMGATSLTFPNLKVVVDSMLIKRREIDPSTGNVKISLTNISRDEYIQRRGRVGRSSAGHYFAMMTGARIAGLRSNVRSEVAYLPLYRICLNLIRHGVNPSDIFQSPDISEATDLDVNLEDRMEQTMRELFRLQLIDDIGALTDAGRFVLMVRLQLYPAVLLWRWMQQKYPPWPGLIIATLIDNYGPYWSIRKTRDQSPEEYAKLVHSKFQPVFDAASNDLEVQLYIWQLLMAKSNQMLAYFTPVAETEMTPDYRRTKQQEIRLLGRAVRDMQLDSNNIRKLLFSIKLNTEILVKWLQRRKSRVFMIAKFNAAEAFLAAQKLFKPIYAHKVLQKERDHYVDADKNRYYLDSTSVMKQSYPQEIVTLATLQIKQSRFIRLGINTKALPTLEKSLVTEAPDVHTYRPGPVKILRRPSSKLNLEVMQMHVSDAITHNGPDAVRIFQQDLHLRQALQYRPTNINTDNTLLGDLSSLIRLQNRVIPEAPVGGEFVYNPRKGELKSVNKWGQRKLFFAVLEFLLGYVPQFPNALILYVGAAPGTNITILSRMFPELEWHLYDPREFNADLHQNPKVKIFQQLFTDKDLGRYISRQQPMLFISDIRQSLETKDPNQPLKVNEDRISEDLELQKQWVLAMKPEASHLKFRMPFLPGETEYFVGNAILTQPWTSATSAETRLYVMPDKAGNFAMRKYNHNAYEQSLYEYNTGQRTWYFINQQVQVSVPGYDYPAMDHCFDCFQEISLWHYYLTNIVKTPAEQVLAQIPQMVTYLSQQLSGGNRNMAQLYKTEITESIEPDAGLALTEESTVNWYRIWLTLKRWWLEISVNWDELNKKKVGSLIAEWIINALNETSGSKLPLLQRIQEANTAKGELLNQLRPLRLELDFSSLTRLAIAPDNLTLINKGEFYIGQYQVQANNRIRELLLNYSPDEVASLLLRYALLDPSGLAPQFQFSMNYRNDRGTIAMGSPLEVRRLDQPYCSLYPEDVRFGSLGNFFTLDTETLHKQRWLVNPPYTDLMITATVSFLMQNAGVKYVLYLKRDEEHPKIKELSATRIKRQVLPQGTYNLFYWERKVTGSINLLKFIS